MDPTIPSTELSALRLYNNNKTQRSVTTDHSFDLISKSQALIITLVCHTVMTWAALTLLALTCRVARHAIKLNITGMNTHLNIWLKILFLSRFLFLKCAQIWLDRTRQPKGCDTQTALPLFENQSIIQQPLDLWALTEQYANAAATQMRIARYVFISK